MANRGKLVVIDLDEGHRDFVVYYGPIDEWLSSNQENRELMRTVNKLKIGETVRTLRDDRDRMHVHLIARLA